jgi:hypothetical protein
VHPTFLYELLWNLLVFAFLLYIDRKYRLGHGRLFALYIASYCVGRFWVELMRDDSATHIAGIRINVFTAMFVFIGAVVYMLLAPKGREDPATLRGHAPVEESAVEEVADELVAAAKGSGILAAVTVASEHEQDDAEAVGDDAGLVDDLADADADADFVAEVETEEVATEAEAELESEIVESESESEAELAADDGPVVVYENAPETETVVVYETPVDNEPEVADVEVEAEVELDAEPEAEAEAEAEPELVIDTEPEPELVIDTEPEPEPELVIDTEPEPEDSEPEDSEPELVVEISESDRDAKPVGFGPTLRRLLWGVSSTSKD